MINHPHLAQRAVWILETLYAADGPEGDAALSSRVAGRLGVGEGWPGAQAGCDSATLLAEHARRVCHESAPDCAGCELRKFCARYRDEQQEAWRLDTASPTVVDLFSGAGGASLGFTQAGFRLLAAVDWDPWAIMTLRLNHPELPAENAVEQDLSELEQDPGQRFRRQLERLVGNHRVDVVIGGPPCQGFSLIGTSGRSSARFYRRGQVTADSPGEPQFREDPKNVLYKYFLTLVDWLRPRFVIMENVPAMVDIGDGRIARQVQKDIADHGNRYSVPAPRVFNCADYGVPQDRRRAFFVGLPPGFGITELRSDGQVHFDLPRALPHMVVVGNPGMVPGELTLKPRVRVTLGDAVRDLPPLAANTGHEVCRRTSEPRSAYALELAGGTRLVHNHVARPHQASDLEIYSLLRPGERIRDRPDLWERNKYRAYSFSDIYKRQHYDAVSSTVIAHLAKDGNMFIHPEQNRTYSVREAARVQSFPDDFIFCGSRTAQFRQVGNAVPPLFAQRLAEAIATLLGHREASGDNTVQLTLDL